MPRDLDIRIGTLWWIDEKIWRAELPLYDEIGNRDRHPGLSILDKPLHGRSERAPFLHGTSGDGGPVVVRGVSRSRPPEHPTSFGRLVTPACLAPDLVGTSDCEQNNHKPKLTQRELDSLRHWAKRRRLL